LRNDVERSFNIETEVLAELSLDWFLLPLIFIDDIEELVDLAMFVMNYDVLVFSVESSRNIHNFTFLIDDESTIFTEHLPPS
jgi:hypothetical protein